MKKRIFSICIIFCVIIGMLFSVPTVSAAEIKKGIIEIASVEGEVGEEVVVPIAIKENPGIMAVTVSITYDPEVLEYVSYYYGNVFNDYTVAAHPDRKLIRLVICDTRNKRNDGNIISFRFNVTDKAKAEFTKINLEYSKGDLCNWNLDKIMPEVVSGGVEVAFNGENCPHKKYGEWKVISEPACKEVGVNERVCDFCGHKEYKETSPIGHTYSENWTVDKPATAEKDGTMSRYCIRCDDYVDRITFSLEQSEKEEIDNIIWEDVADKETAEEIFKEQNPGKKPTQNTTSIKDGSSSKDKTSSGSSSAGKDEKPKDSSNNTEESNSSEKPTQNPEQNPNSDEKQDSSTTESKQELLDTDKILEELFPEIETADGETVNVYEKLLEAFPDFEKTLKISQAFIIILLFIIVF